MLMRHLNNGLTNVEHVPPTAGALAAHRADPDAYHAELCGSVFEILRHRLLTVDSHPIESRFFTFRLAWTL